MWLKSIPTSVSYGMNDMEKRRATDILMVVSMHFRLVYYALLRELKMPPIQPLKYAVKPVFLYRCVHMPAVLRHLGSFSRAAQYHTLAVHLHFS